MVPSKASWGHHLYLRIEEEPSKEMKGTELSRENGGKREVTEARQSRRNITSVQFKAGISKGLHKKTVTLAGIVLVEWGLWKIEPDRWKVPGE